MDTIPEHHLFWQGETPLTCVSRIEETPDTTTFVLVAATRQFFSFLPGQFISVSANIDGKAHWRAYSISSSPAQPDTVSITVRRVAGGLVSNWLLDNVRSGVELPAMAPAGDFALQAADVPANIALFSAGCGITPMMSMTRWLLETRTATDIHFFHSARSEDEFIFRDELQDLAAQHVNLKLHLFLTQPKGRVDCHRGRLDAARIAGRVGAAGGRSCRHPGGGRGPRRAAGARSALTSGSAVERMPRTAPFRVGIAGVTSLLRMVIPTHSPALGG